MPEQSQDGCVDHEAVAALLAPGDPDARMEAYYYGFERTGFAIIDDILSAVATAGKHYHGTDQWAEPDFEPPGGRLTEEASIQAAANRGAAALRALACRVERRSASTDSESACESV